jgi:putative Mg2+ transporter-C (MgtC) family protein
MLDSPSAFDAVVRLAAAILLGAVLGWDRERRDKPAGLRTHAMVCLGAAVYTLVTIHFFTAGREAGSMNVDAIRLIDGLVGGIGFLGAGTIIRARGHVEGITTAASIWVAGAVGLACGIGEFVLAGLTILAALVALEGLGLVKKQAKPERSHPSASPRDPKEP